MILYFNNTLFDSTPLAYWHIRSVHIGACPRASRSPRARPASGYASWAPGAAMIYYTIITYYTITSHRITSHHITSHTCVYIYMFIYTYIYIYIYICIYIYIYIPRIPTLRAAQVRACMYVCIYIYMYIEKDPYVYIYIYIHTRKATGHKLFV